MKLKYLIVVFILALPLLSIGSGLTGYQDADTAGIKGALPDSVLIKQPVQPVAKADSSDIPESKYYIDIKEDRAINNYFTRHYFTTYSNKGFRKTLIDKGNEKLPKPIASLYTRIVDKAFRFPFVVFFLAVILLLIFNVLTVIVILFVTNLIMNVRAAQKAKLRDQYEKILTDLMLQVIDTKEAIEQLSRIKQKNNNLLIEVMMDFQKSFRGDSDRQLMDLYQEMNLGKISYKKTFSASFYKQVMGIRELTNMHPDQAIEMISSRLNESNSIVRTEAQISYPYVNTENPFEFLSILEKPFSRWAQLNIYYYIKIHELPVPSFDKWLKSDNINVVNFCILMIALFQQRENSGEIIRLLNDPNESTRYEAINACSELDLFESKSQLKKLFPTDTLKNQIEILKTLRNIGDDSDVPFIEEILQSEEKSLRLEACRTINMISESSRAHLDVLNQSMNFELTHYIAHIKDSRN
jgi:hypothetical protein